MREKLEDYLELLVRYDNEYHYEHLSDTPHEESSKTAGEMSRREPTVRQIMKALDPDLNAYERDYQGSWGSDQPPVPGEARLHQANIQRAIGLVEDQQEWAVRLAPDTPVLRANLLHPWVWDAAKTFWESKHFQKAVDVAANSINAHTQTLIERDDIADADLMNQAFTEKPKPGEKHLRLPGDPNNKTVKSRNNALRPYAFACFAGMRNPAVHEHGGSWSEEKAFEYLVALSVLARWIEECDVLTA
ncbi:TIGR02391 family protein [Catenulispora subtropica]|uniref:Conserved hypothetical protein CHP02391 domain-containing protein n=1 Tax=Catenulispora subtropica TaxID=450798 RepID=A0ABN2QWH9_9ACTN